MTTNAKIACVNCGRFVKERALYYHKCDSALSSSLLCSAWKGDREHSLDVINFLLDQGFGPDVSSTYLVTYIKDQAQALYLDKFSLLPPKYKDLNVHNRSQVFEALYHDDPTFREDYKRRLLTYKDGSICTSLSPAEYSSLSHQYPLPTPVKYDYVLSPSARNVVTHTTSNVLNIFSCFLKNFILHLVVYFITFWVVFLLLLYIF
jgi:hypothetical protein